MRMETTPIERGEKYEIIVTLPNYNLAEVTELLSNLAYYMSEHGGFEEYIPKTIKKLENLGVKVTKK